ncbi:NF038120 family PEP-CTERM protein [Duganella callida]|uniref:PEP-CTERM sorting domain-containing protein n=1 Tax=Duganella callida TaxID=2561932 RepID=A0A4Y9SXM6_9BURK|nr:NF038120 family PEP-CTERM protein [Duganella callida]TFW29383.1 PEP-CTERM sorting domain-containing protein [Duganella callida]
MKRLLLLGWATSLASCALLSTSHAATIDFETVTNVVSPVLADGDSLYANGDQFRTGGFLATVSDSRYAQSLPDYQPGGLAGMVMNSWTSCIINACPYNESHFFAGMNGGSITLQREDGAAFRLESLNYGFISRDWDLPPMVYGRLMVEATLADGSVVKLEQDMPAEEPMSLNWDFSAQLGGRAISRVEIGSCVFDSLGACVNNDSTLNQAQFALDNINVSAVPEPAEAALLLAGLSLLAARRRRGKPAAAGGAA